LHSSGYKEFYCYKLKGIDFNFNLTDFADIKRDYDKHIRDAQGNKEFKCKLRMYRMTKKNKQDLKLVQNHLEKEYELTDKAILDGIDTIMVELTGYCTDDH